MVFYYANLSAGVIKMLIVNTIKKILFCLCVTCSFACHASITLTPKEASSLEGFFRFVFEETGAAYVLEGVKPLCVLGISSGDELGAGFDCHQMSVVLREGMDVWNNKIDPLQKKTNYMIHSYNNPDAKFAEHQHVLFINKKLFLETVEKNLSLFQYVLGPSVTPEKVLEQITSKDSSFSEALGDHNNVLVGIILGYGTKNAITVSRMEEIDLHFFSGDALPYLAKNQSLEQERAMFFMSDDQPWLSNKMKPSFGYQSVEKEYEALKALVTLPPEELADSQAPFYFGYCIGDPQSLKLIESLQSAQKNIQSWLKSDSVLEKAFSCFVGEGFEIEKKEAWAKNRVNQDDSDLIAKSVVRALTEFGYTHDQMQLYIDGFESPDEKERMDRYMGSPLYLEMVDAAKQHLVEANGFFRELRQRDNMVNIIPGYLSYQIQERGSGLKLDRFSKLYLDYTIYHPDGHVLVEKKDHWIDISETIPGFAHGVQGMQQGETRMLFIHPVYAYGIRTFSEKGIHLTAKVTLKDVLKEYSNPLPALKQDDLLLVFDSEWYQTQKEKQEKALRVKGRTFYHFISNGYGIDPARFADRFKHYISSEFENNKISDDEEVQINQVYWNAYMRRGKIGV